MCTKSDRAPSAGVPRARFRTRPHFQSHNSVRAGNACAGRTILSECAGLSLLCSLEHRASHRRFLLQVGAPPMMVTRPCPSLVLQPARPDALCQCQSHGRLPSLGPRAPRLRVRFHPVRPGTFSTRFPGPGSQARVRTGGRAAPGCRWRRLGWPGGPGCWFKFGGHPRGERFIPRRNRLRLRSESRADSNPGPRDLCADACRECARGGTRAGGWRVGRAGRRLAVRLRSGILGRLLLA
jgi:hypothetical protein